MNVCDQCGWPIYQVEIQGQVYWVSHLNKIMGGRLVCPRGEGKHGPLARLFS